MLGYLSCLICWRMLIFPPKFKVFKKKTIQEHYQSAKRHGSRSGLTFWVQTVCKCCQQTINVAASKKRVKIISEIKSLFLFIYFYSLLIFCLAWFTETRLILHYLNLRFIYNIWRMFRESGFLQRPKVGYVFCHTQLKKVNFDYI